VKLEGKLKLSLPLSPAESQLQPEAAMAAAVVAQFHKHKHAGNALPLSERRRSSMSTSSLPGCKADFEQALHFAAEGGAPPPEQTRVRHTGVLKKLAPGTAVAHGWQHRQVTITDADIVFHEVDTDTLLDRIPLFEITRCSQQQAAPGPGESGKGPVRTTIGDSQEAAGGNKITVRRSMAVSPTSARRTAALRANRSDSDVSCIDSVFNGQQFVFCVETSLLGHNSGRTYCLAAGSQVLDLRAGGSVLNEKTE
jgi:hypothetical protein